MPPFIGSIWTKGGLYVEPSAGGSSIANGCHMAGLLSLNEKPERRLAPMHSPQFEDAFRLISLSILSLIFLLILLCLNDGPRSTQRE
jgi:hypothetical protein